MDLKKHIGARIKELRLSRGWNQEKLAGLLDTTKQTVSRYESGERSPNQDVLFRLSDIFVVKIDEFFPMRVSSFAVKRESNYLIGKTREYHYLPTSISAGLPLDVEAVTESETIQIPDSLMGKWSGDNEIFFSKINGDSMDRIIPDKSLIAIKPIEKESLKDGDIVVFSDSHDYSVKYFYKTPDKLIFKPASYNRQHHEQHFNIDDGVQIHGKVVLYIVELD